MLHTVRKDPTIKQPCASVRCYSKVESFQVWNFYLLIENLFRFIQGWKVQFFICNYIIKLISGHVESGFSSGLQFGLVNVFVYCFM